MTNIDTNVIVNSSPDTNTRTEQEAEDDTAQILDQFEAHEASEANNVANNFDDLDNDLADSREESEDYFDVEFDNIVDNHEEFDFNHAASTRHDSNEDIIEEEEVITMESVVEETTFYPIINDTPLSR